MQIIMESAFDILYLITVLFLGITMFVGSKPGSDSRLFGTMAIVLGSGDAFHLIPRVYGLLTNGLENHVVAIGIGKLLTSITMTVFYVILFHFWKKHYKVANAKRLTRVFYGLAAVKIMLSLMPQNDWFNAVSPYDWGIYRNIPFTAMGLIIIWLFYDKAHKTKDVRYSKMWLAVTLSFAFYAPVILWANQYPLIGMLMIPKTLAYVWIVWMGWREFRKTTHFNAKILPSEK